MNSIIEIANLMKDYGSLHVLDNISFKAKKGEFVSIIGPSGCGKSTLLKIIGGLIQPTSGNIKIQNNPPSNPVRKRQFAFVFQDPILLQWRTAIKNIELPLEIAGQQNSHWPKKLLSIVGLLNFENHYPNELSGGMQQRVAIARALTLEPTVLLMDEPFGALDEITRDKLNLELLKIWKEEKKTISTILFVTHSIPEAVFLSDKIVVLSERPAKVKKIIDVELSRPRKVEMKYSTEFMRSVECLRRMLKKD